MLPTVRHNGPTTDRAANTGSKNPESGKPHTNSAPIKNLADQLAIAQKAPDFLFLLYHARPEIATKSVLKP